MMKASVETGDETWVHYFEPVRKVTVRDTARMVCIIIKRLLHSKEYLEC